MLVERDEGMAWMGLTGRLFALRAVVPVGAVKALVADAIDVLRRSARCKTDWRIIIDVPYHSHRKSPSGVDYGQQASNPLPICSIQSLLKPVQSHEVGDGHVSWPRGRECKGRSRHTRCR